MYSTVKIIHNNNYHIIFISKRKQKMKRNKMKCLCLKKKIKMECVASLLLPFVFKQFFYYYKFINVTSAPYWTPSSFSIIPLFIHVYIIIITRVLTKEESSSFCSFEKKNGCHIDECKRFRPLNPSTTGH